MALIVCPECGHKISEYAGFCPSCGCPKSYFKQILAEREKNEKKISNIQQESVKSDVIKFKESLNSKQLKIFSSIDSEITKRFSILEGKEYKSYYGYSYNKSPFKCIVLSKNGSKLVLKYRKSNKNDSELFVFSGAKLTETNDVLLFINKLLKTYKEKEAPSRSPVSETKPPIVQNKGMSLEQMLLEQRKQAEIDKLRKNYKYTVRDNKVEHISITKIEKIGKRTTIYYEFKDKTTASCNLEDIKHILFPTEYIAILGLDDSNTFKGEDDGKTYLVYSAGGFFGGWKEEKKYETAGREAHEVHGSFVLVQIPKITTVNYATRFYTKEGADKIAKLLESIYGFAEVREYKPK